MILRDPLPTLGVGPGDYPGLLGITRDYSKLLHTVFDTCFAHRFSHRSGSFLGPSWHRFWIDFGEVLEVENDANNDLDENVKMVFLLKRKHNFEGSEAPQKPSQNPCNKLFQASKQNGTNFWLKNCQHDRNMGPNLGPKRAQNWKTGTSRVFLQLFFDTCSAHLGLKASWEPLGTLLAPFWAGF